jgi:hypothetical protein
MSSPLTYLSKGRGPCPAPLYTVLVASERVSDGGSDQNLMRQVVTKSFSASLGCQYLVPGTLDHLYTLTLLAAREDIAECRHRERYETCRLNGQFCYNTTVAFL